MTRGPRQSPTDPTHEDNWSGGYYEFSIKLGAADDARLDVALAALWHAASLPKPLRRHPDEAPEVSAQALLAGPLNAVATIPGLGSSLCVVMVGRAETDDSGVALEDADWLDLCLPLGALANLDERVGGYPFDGDGDTRGWREPIEHWFATVASAVFEAVPFVHAVTDDEVSGSEVPEVQQGLQGVFRRSPEGGLEVEPVQTWS
ncbi:hypothetical protein [Nocardioides sp. W7]|uniref:hypothetical protein n=1 Tax=Nocardioides sp. W7 TaxID=2931390 RepID=UPI001FD441F3|nr:hypothetical protein [Nocardioides sp. W7]